MKKALSFLLAVIMILTMSACAKTGDAPKSTNPPQQENPGDGTQQETGNTPADPASDKLTLSEYLKNESDTPLVFFVQDSRTRKKETVPSMVLAFQNGKVKAIPNVNHYSFGDFAKMTDAEALQSAEQALDTFLRSYVEDWQSAMDAYKKGDPGSVSVQQYYITQWALDRTYDDEKDIDVFEHSTGDGKLYETATAQGHSFGKYIGATLYFHPTKYYLPDYVDYVFNIVSDESGNKIEDVYLTYNFGKYFDGDIFANYYSTYYKDNTDQWEFIPDSNASYYTLANTSSKKPLAKWPDPVYTDGFYYGTALHHCLVTGDFDFPDTCLHESEKQLQVSFYGLPLFNGQPEYHADAFSVYDSTFYSISSKYTFCTRDKNVQNVTFEYIKGETIDSTKLGGNVLVDALNSEIWKAFQKLGG